MSYETIKTESQRNGQLPTDMDAMRSRYLLEDKIYETEEYDKTIDLSVKLPAFEIFALEKNRFKLLVNSITTRFINKWTYRPDYASYDLYGSVMYWYIILFINGIDAIEYFADLDTIIIPDIIAIRSLASDRISERRIERIESTTPKSIYNNFIYKSFLFDDYKTLKNNALEILQTTGNRTETEVYSNESVEENFTVTYQIKRQQYIEISNTPTNLSSISVYFGNMTNPLRYGVDYILINDVKLTWSPNYSAELSRSILNSVSMQIDKNIRVQYTKTTVNLIQ